MALAAIGYAKARRRRQIMIATSSIGPGALNMVTAAGVAHSNRLPMPDPRGRYLRDPASRSGASAGRALRRPHHHRERRLQGGLALLGPDQPPGADHGVDAAGHRHHARPRRLRPGLRRATPGHPGARLRLSGRVLRGEGVDDPAPPARPRAPGRGRGAAQDGEEAAHHLGRRRALFRCRGGRFRVCRRTRDSGGRDHCRKGRAHPRGSGPLRPHRRRRLDLGQYAGG